MHDESTGCYYYETSPAPIPSNSSLTTNDIVESNITCVGSADGNVSFNIVSNYATSINVSYEILNSQTLITTGITGSGTVPANGTLSVTNLGNLDFGNYVVVVTEEAGATNAGCSVVTIPFNITESAFDLNITAQVSKNENCDALGVISATASFGTAPYQYQVVPTGDAPNSSWGTPNTFELAAGVYDVYVRDAYGCEKFDTVTLIKDAEPTLDPVAQHCFDGTAFNITLSGTTFDGTATYSIGGAYQSNPVFTITAAGTYTLSIKDANGCIATDTFIVAPPLLLDAVLDLDLTCDVDGSISLTANGGTGTYTTYEVSNDGGTTYTVVGGTTFTTNTDGTYIFRVTDDQGCMAVSNVVIVTPKTTPTLTHIQTDVSCHGGADGTIIVTADNGIKPYQYSLDGGPFQNSNIFKNLSAGTYTIVVSDGKNCDSAAITVTITEPTLVAGDIILTQGLTCGIGNATQPAIVTVTGSGGTAPYTYSFDGVNYTTTNTYKTLLAGTVTAYVKDANGCSISDPIEIVIPALSVPTDLDFVATPVTCIATESTVTLTATDGVGALTYEIIAPASATGNTTGATSGIFAGLVPDTYTFTVTDANGCYYTEAYTVIPVTNLTVSGLLIADVSCFGGNDGAVTFEVAKFSGTFSYEINGGATVSGQTNTTISVTGLSAGDQTIVVTDDTTGCTATYTVTVSEPTAVALTETNVNAYCDFGAVVTVEASGGTAPYRYAFVVDGSAPVAADYTNSNSAVLDPAISTNWDVWVMDSQGCTDQIDVVIATDPLPTVDVPTFAINQCTVTNGFEFTVTNPTGVAPLTYSIGNGFQSSPTFTVANAGTYMVTIKDAHGCTNAVPVSIEIYPALALTPTITSLATCANDDGEITVTAVGGSGTYSYSISPNPAGVTVAGNIFSGVPSGSYVITIEDTLTGCTETANIALDAATPVDFTLTPTDASCHGGSDGTITVDLTVGNDDNPVYTYEIVGPITRPAQNSNVFIGLEAGTYTVQVNSGRGCVAVKDVVVGEPDVIVVAAPIVVDYACTVGSNATTFASISINAVTGGSGTYTKYEFIRGATVVQSGTQNVYTETNLLGGSYTINVYDNNGCVGFTTAVIQPFISIDALSVAIDTAITCTNDESITVSVSSTGGVPTNLEFTLEQVGGTILTQVNRTGVFTGLPVGNYKITVVNLDTGCTLQTVHYVNEPNTFDLTVDTVVDVTCFSGNDGSVNVTFIDRSPTPTDEAGPFNYTVVNALGVPVASGTTPNAGPIAITGLFSGTYTITASLTNSPFCTVVKNFTITAPNAALTVFETHTEITCVSGNNDGSIFATATGGWPGAYEFELSGTTIATIPYSSNGSFKNLSAGVYTVSVRDSSGCIDTAIVELTNPLPITFTANADVIMLSCFGDQNATITVNLPTGGQGSNYKYTLNTISPAASSSGPQLSPVFSGLGAGTYSVTVTDGYNCSTTSVDIVIAQPVEMEAKLVATTTPTCDVDATLTLSASGGTGVYTYSTSSTFATIGGTFTTSTTFAVTPGTYKYYVRDANGCEVVVTNDIKIDPIPELTLILTSTNPDINCAGDNNGVVIAKAQGGLGNYVYTLLDAAGNPVPSAVQNTPGVFTELYAGTYQVAVVSGDCNATSGNIEITEPLAPLDATPIVSNVSCFGGNNGSIEINATGGTGVIKYAISPQSNQFFDSNVFENLAPGTYDIIVQDELGCYLNLSVTITEPTQVIVGIVPNSILPEVCEGDVDGEFSINISGGTGPYEVSLDDYNGTYTVGSANQTQFDFTGLSGGDHVVYVRDSAGCESEWNITLPESVKIEPVAVVEYLCDDNAPGNRVTVNVDDSITDMSELHFSLNGGPIQSSNVFNNVVAGIGHSIEVTHTNGCVKTTLPFDIDHVDPLLLGINDGGMNEIVAMATGGTGGYEFTLNGENLGNTSSFIITRSGDYTVTVTDSSGCVATATRYFEFIDICIPNYFTPNGDNNQDTWAPGCAINYPNMEFKIFDRYGREVGTYRQGQAWDGKYREKELPTGDYWYIVKLNNGKDDRDFVGHFTLYR